MLFKLVLNINIAKNSNPTEIELIERRIRSLKNNQSIDVKLIRNLLSQMPNYTSYVVTNINDMIAELFTNSGRGTFFKLSETILVTDNLKEMDMRKMTSLLERSFNKKLKREFFETLSERKPVFFRDENYSALAIVTRQIDGFPYLDKFCVAPENQVTFFSLKPK
jgi:acetylglutamate synthase